MTFDAKTMEFFRKMGSKGGNKTKKLYGTKHFSKISKGRKLSTSTPLSK